MVEVLEFVFRDFWHFAGSVILLYIAILPIIAICGSVARNRH